MSASKGKGQAKSGVLSGLVIIMTGFIAGYCGLDLALSAHDAGATRATTQSASPLSRQLDEQVTASLGATGFDGIKRQFASFFSGSDYLGGGQTGRADGPAARPNSSNIAVNRRLKTDRTVMAAKTSLAKVAINAGSASQKPTVSAHKPAQPAPPVVKPQLAAQMLSDPRKADVASAAKPEDAATYLTPRRPEKAMQPPYADNVDMALFAAEMPMPARLSARGLNGAPSGGQASHYTPLIPRTFISGKAFGGLGEEEFQKRERRCMVTALYFEARSEPDSGQIAVGQVIMNRVKSPDFPDTICGVIYQGSLRDTGCQFSFTCDGKPDRPDNKAEWERSIRVADQILEGKVWLKEIGDSTHYHANYVKPTWRREMAKTRQVGRHIFYKSPEVSITDPFQRIGGDRS